MLDVPPFLLLPSPPSPCLRLGFINSKVNEMTDVRPLIVVQPVAGPTN